MEKAVQTTASFATDRGIGAAFLLSQSGSNNVASWWSTSWSCGYLCMMTELPPQSEYRWGRRYREQPVLLLIEVHVRRFFSSTGRGQQYVELLDDVMVTLSVGRV